MTITGRPGAFAFQAAVFPLLLLGWDQTVCQTKEFTVTPSDHTICALLQEVVSPVRVTAEFRPNVNPEGHAVDHALITSIVEGAMNAERHNCKAESSQDWSPSPSALLTMLNSN